MRGIFFLALSRIFGGRMMRALIIGYMGSVTTQGLVGSYGKLDATNQATFLDIMVRDLSLLESFYFGE